MPEAKKRGYSPRAPGEPFLCLRNLATVLYSMLPLFCRLPGDNFHRLKKPRPGKTGRGMGHVSPGTLPGYLPRYASRLRLSRQHDKLVFENAHSKYAVIASQCAHWRGNPPVRWKMYRQLPYRAGIVAIFGGNRYLVPFIRGIATTSVRTGLAMTAKNVQTPISRFAGLCRSSRRDSGIVNCPVLPFPW